MNLHYYTTKSGKNPVKEYIKSLPTKEKIDGYSVLEYMEAGEMDKVKFKRWQKKVYEVYFYKDNRIFYIAADGNDMYLVHACRKQKNKTEKQDKNIVIDRVKELEKELGKAFI